MTKRTLDADALTETLLDSASETFDAARRRALARLRKAGLSDAMANLSLLASLTEAAERCAPEVRERRTTAAALTGNAVPFRRTPR